MCKIKQLNPNYIQFQSNAKTLRDRNTSSNAIRYRTNQEIKFLHRKKQNLNTQLYRINLQLECADQCNSVWQRRQNSTETKLNQNLDTLYPKLNKKLDTLTKRAQTIHINTKNTNSQPRLINLAKIHFTKEHINTLALVPNYTLGHFKIFYNFNYIYELYICAFVG